jgi:hypothetical protein
MSYILAVSKATKNVLTATDPNDFIFHSDYNTFKIIAEGRLLSQTINTHPKELSYNHDLGYAPSFYAFCEFPDGKVVLAGPLSHDYTVQPYEENGYGSFSVEADSDNLYFMFEDTSWMGSSHPGNYDVDIKWYIFETEI